MGDAGSEIMLAKGSAQRVKPFVSRHCAAMRDPEELTITLYRVGLDSPQVCGRWNYAQIANRATEWADDVIDTVKERTEVAGQACEFSLEATRPDGQVERSYPLAAKPMSENLSPTPEGLVHLAMRQSSAMVQTMLADRSSVIETYAQTIEHLRRELDRKDDMIRGYQQREEQSRERELALLDRERKLLMAEAEEQSSSRERQDERIDRVLEKGSEVVEAMGIEAVRAAVEKVAPEHAAKLLQELGPAIAKLIGVN